MSRASVTIEDVAKASGVSRQTVSRVINNATNVSASARERVEASIAQMGYVPNLAARRMGGALSYVLLALIARDPSGASKHLPLGEMLTAGIEACSKAGYHLMFEQIEAGDETQCARRLTSVLGALQPDGVVVIPPLDDSSALRSALAERKVRTEYLGKRSEFGRCVPGLDEGAYAERAAQRLVDLGHRQVGFVTGTGNRERSKRRLEGYRRVLARAGSRAHRHFISEGPGDYPAALKLARSWLTPTIRPTAVLAETAEIALAFHQVAGELGVSVPREISLLSLADADALERAKPAITALNLPYDTLFARACERLMPGTSEASGTSHDESLEDFAERASLAKAPRAV